MKYYGMHRHFTDAGCVLLFGGGMQEGLPARSTADERPCKTLEKRVVIEDLHASIFQALGISPKLRPTRSRSARSMLPKTAWANR